jgi:hypothetical protein
MKLGLLVGAAGPRINMDLILEAEKLGYDSVWTGEAYGSDAVTPLAWIGSRTSKIKLGAAILQMPARTPAMTAMTAMTLDALSGGRFLLCRGHVNMSASSVKSWREKLRCSIKENTTRSHMLAPTLPATANHSKASCMVVRI